MNQKFYYKVLIFVSGSIKRLNEDPLTIFSSNTNKQSFKSKSSLKMIFLNLKIKSNNKIVKIMYNFLFIIL
jgi:hypothetical protein